MPKGGLFKYHIIGTLWVGQSSIVYRATDAQNRVVAIKMLLPEAAARRGALRDMDREARLSLRLRHPRIVECFEYIRDAPVPALIMEYFSSENLKMRIVRSPELIREHARDIIVQVCEALAYVHSLGFVHRDMKPENVLVADNGETKIIDFALALEMGRGWFFTRRPIAGTRPYIAPETIRRRAPDERTDIYSLGITIYEMLAGRPPFVSGDRDEILRKHLTEQPPLIRTYNRDVSPQMDGLILQMLSKRRDDRPANIDEVLRRLEGIRVFDK